jgi:beta-lactamase regulating signal transducer with metallopeptidase domain
MNIGIILSFILMIGAILTLMYPKNIALRLSNINKYDLETIPKGMLILVYVVAFVAFIAATTLLIYLLNQTLFLFPDEIVDFFNSLM